MFDSTTTFQKLCLLRIIFGIIGVSTQSRIKSNDPVIYALFVDTFGVFDQNEIYPLMCSILKIEQDVAVRNVSLLSDSIKKELLYYLLNIAGDHQGMKVCTNLIFRQIENGNNNMTNW